MLPDGFLDRDGGFSPATRFAENRAAIEVLYGLESEQRAASDEERQTLARYNGFGGLADVFDSFRRNLDPWADNGRTWVQETLTEEDRDSAYRTTLNAHYTSPAYVDALWQAAREAGFRGGRVLEPSAGIGTILGRCPSDLVQRSTFTAVELDRLPGRMLSYLYPDADVRVGSFTEQDDLPDDYYDLVITNVPFGDYSARDARYPRESIHNQMILRSLDKLRPGGVMVAITSRYTLDKLDSTSRRAMHQRAHLAGAFRLPPNAQAAQAGTTVTTDVLVFVGRDQPPMPTEQPAWLSASRMSLPHPVLERQMAVANVNDWLQNNLADVVAGGELHLVRSGPARIEVVANEVADGAQWLAERVGRLSLPAAVVTTSAAAEADDGGGDGRVTVEVSNVTRREIGSLVFDDEGRLGRVVDDRSRNDADGLEIREHIIAPLDVSGREQQRLTGLVHLRDATEELLTAQLDGAPEDEEQQARERLNRVYDDFVARFGYINAKANARLLRGTPDAGRLRALEHWDAEHGTADKADIFTRSVIDPGEREAVETDDPAEALAYSLNVVGEPNERYIARALGVAPDSESLASAMHRLNRDQQIFRNPSTGAWEIAAKYLSGHVREKLTIARKAAEEDDQYRRNVEALEQVVPTDVPIEQIEKRIGAPWIPEAYYHQFICDLIEIAPFDQGDLEVYHSPYDGSWTVAGSGVICNRGLLDHEYGTQDRNALTLIERMLNGRGQTVMRTVDEGDRKRQVIDEEATLAAQAAAEKIQQRWKEWIEQEPERAADLARIYNDRLNGWRAPVYDGSHLRLPGMAPTFEPRAHQRNAIWRNIVEGRGCNAHCVGAGKTAVGVATAMEWRRLGVARRPCLVVPNHLREQMESAARQLYPGARILAPTNDDKSGEAREAFLHRAANNDYDLVLLTHSMFHALEIPPEDEKRLLKARIAELQAQLDHEDRPPKGVAKRLENLESRMARLVDGARKKQGIYLDELGVDAFIIDEADEVMRTTPIIGGGEVANEIPGSGKGEHALMVVELLREQRGDYKGLLLQTATPIANNILEMYNLQRYLQPDTMRRVGVELANDWAHTFLRAESQVEAAPEGGVKSKTRFVLVNAPELARMAHEVLDVIDADDIQLPRPNMETRRAVVDLSDADQAMLSDLHARVEKIANGVVKPSEDNLLAVIGDGRKLALDTRLLDPTEADHPGSKLQALAANVTAEAEEHAADRAAQLVFCDLGTPTGNAYLDVYGALRDILVREHGWDAGEIAFIHDYPTDAKKAQLYQQVRDGRVRVLVGSTSRMGMGMNVQDRICAMHHLDLPWKPRDLEQRDGRGQRQGNLFDNIRRYFYTKEGSFDAFILERILFKQGQFSRFLKGRPEEREFSPEVDFELAEVAGVTAGDDTVRQIHEAETQVSRLRALKKEHEGTQRSIRQQIETLDRSIRREESFAERVAAVDAVEDPQWYLAGSDGWQAQKGLSEAKPKIRAGIANVEEGKVQWEGVRFGDRPIGVYRDGFDASGSATYQFVVDIGGTLYDFTPGDAREIPKILSDPASYAAQLRDEVARSRDHRDQLAQQRQPFPQEEELREAVAWLESLRGDHEGAAGTNEEGGATASDDNAVVFAAEDESTETAAEVAHEPAP